MTGREIRRWHAAGTDKTSAEKLARRLARELNGPDDRGRGLTFGAFLTQTWLPAKRIELRSSTFDGYRRIVARHVLPALGSTKIRRLRPEQLATFLRCAAGHRYFPAIWTAAFTGMRRGELLGLKWSDLDPGAATVSINRALLDIAYDVVKTPDITPQIGASRGKTKTARRRVDVDATTVDLLAAWRTWRTIERCAAGLEPPEWMFTDAHGGPIHPQAMSQTFDRIVRRAPVPTIRFHDLPHTHATLLIAAGVAAKVVAERLGHSRASLTIDSYQHVLPGMQADAAATFAQLIANPASTGSTGTTREKSA